MNTFQPSWFVRLFCRGDAETIDDLNGIVEAQKDMLAVLRDEISSLKWELGNAHTLAEGILVGVKKAVEDKYRLKRAHEVLLTHKPNCHGAHECCACVEAIQQYAKDALASVKETK